MLSFTHKSITKLAAIIFAVTLVMTGFLFFQNTALAAHTLDTSQQNNSLTANPATFSYTSGAGTTVLVLNLVVVNSTARTGGAPTYNGVAMTQADGTRMATETNTEMWYLLNPPTGSAYTVSIPNTNTRTIRAFTATAKAQSGYTSALDVVNGATGTTANPSVSVTTTTAGDFVTSITGHGSNSLGTGNKTRYGGVWGIDHGAYVSMRMYELQAAAGATTHTYTVGADDWGMVVTAFKQVPLVTTVADGATPSSATVAPESGIADLDYFTLATNIGTDSVTAVTVTLAPTGAFNNIAQVDITDNSNVARCTSATSLTSNTVTFSTCTSNGGIPVTTSATTYKVRITPKTHALMPSPSTGTSYATTGTVTNFTSTNASHVLTDTSSATLTVDNLSPGGTSGLGVLPGDTELTVSWTNPTDGDFSNVVVLRDTATILASSTPAEGSSPAVSSSCGGTACQVRYISSGTSLTDTGLTNGATYYYRIFAKDTRGNYTAYASTQEVPGTGAAGNAVPTVTTPTSSAIATSSATLSANVTSLGVPAVISARGTCWGATASPATNCLAEGATTTGVFTHARTGMSPNTLYYYRGYATNTTGTGYSTDGTFTTLSVPTASLSASLTNVTYNASTTLTWSSTNATGCTATGGTFAGAKGTSGSEGTGNLTTSTTYTLYCTGAGGNSSTQSVTVTVGGAATASLSAASSSIAYNTSTTLTWSSTNATGCTATGGTFAGAKATSGSESTGNLTTSTTYTLYCTGAGGNSSTQSVTVTVGGAPITYTITASSGTGGTVEPSEVSTVAQGGSQAYAITPLSGYTTETLLIDSFATTTSTSYTFTNVQTNHTIEATFVALPGVETPITAGPILASITFSGKAFPGGKISIIKKEIGTDVLANQQDVSKVDGSFNIRFTDLPKGIHSFGLLVKDPEGRTSQTKFFLVDANKTDAVFKDIVVPPTVDILSGQVSRGSNVKVFGYASPGHTIHIYLDDILVKEALAGRGGAYSFNLPTGALDFGQHRVRAKQINLDGGKESDFSTTKTFIVSKLAVVKADLNGDGKIDIKDWSIFLARWTSKSSSERAGIDLNSDGKIDIADFSIFIKTIRKK